ncbi:MAG: hypothetical protein D6719_06105 [Candidatus Dadabacteria bacterium]|nr:MAG: hypothetical protein D6719_06105 [Candidatus Dadabacteria bacterium]
MAQEETQEEVALQPWNPTEYLRKVDEWEARLSRGFLRCEPAKWFPGYATSWLPLAHSLGIEVRIRETKPVLSAPAGLDTAFAATVDDEPLGLFMDASSTRVLLDAVVPGASSQASDVVLEYLARRFISSLAITWSGPESSVVLFDSEINPRAIREAGAVKVTIEVNGNRIVLWLALGRVLVERLDGLWRRQVQSVSRLPHAEKLVRIGIAQLAVPPAMLGDYLKSGTIVDLEVPVSDTVVLRTEGTDWLPARLCEVDGKFGVEVVTGPVSPSSLPEGTTRLAIELGTENIPAGVSAELSQVGAIWQTAIPVADRVQLVINDEKVGEARLCVYQGRFAINVI